LVLTFDPTLRKGSLANNSPLLIGAPGILFSNAVFVGLIDEPAIYSRALAANEIMAIRQAGSAGKCKVKPSILVQPLSQKVTAGSNVTLTVTATGTPLLRYQWMLGGLQFSLGATNSDYSFTAQNSVTFTVRVTNLFGSANQF
jgi:hypothetical protein